MIETGFIRFADRPVVQSDARKYPKARGKANGFLNVLGPTEGRGAVLMFRGDLATIDRTQPHSLLITLGGKTLQTQPLYITKTVRVSSGPLDTASAVMMLELADVRWMLNRFTAIDRQYNVRQPNAKLTEEGGEGEPYYLQTLDSGEPWSWKAMLGDIWNQFASLVIGGPTGLPYEPQGLPENFRFMGVNAWHAYNAVLAKLGCAVAYNVAAESPNEAWRIVRLGDEQPDFGDTDALLSATRLIWEGEPETNVTAEVPEVVQVYFRRLDEHWGSQKDTPRDDNWLEQPHHVEGIDVSELLDELLQLGEGEGSELVVPGTRRILWDDRPAVFRFDGELDEDEEEALAERARETATQWVRGQIAPRFWRVFSGIHPEMQPGEVVRAVHWRQMGHGYETEYRAHPGLPVHVPGAMGGIHDLAFDSIEDHWRPGSFARFGEPVWPLETHIVTVTESQVDPETTANAHIGKGKVFRINPENPSSGAELDDCFVLPQTEVPEAVGSRHIGRLIGRWTLDGETLPLYAIEGGIKITWVRGTLHESLSGSGSHQVNVVTWGPSGSESPGDENNRITANNVANWAGAAGDVCWCWKNKDGDWEIVQVQCPET